MSPSQKTLREKLYRPYQEFKSRPSKRLRPRLVKLGFLVGQSGRISAEDRKNLSRLQTLLEDLHNGSLIIDDIQDQSPLRRGLQSMHRIIGEPLAINCGNWIYFKSLQAVFRFEKKIQNKLLFLFINELYKGHQGQALDLGVLAWDLKQNQVAQYVKKSADLKTGTLIKMALFSGCYLSSKERSLSKVQKKNLAEFAVLFGSVLQLWNDLQFFKSNPKKNHSLENFEDFVQGRPTFFWSLLSQNLTPSEYQKICRDFQARQNNKQSLIRYLLSQTFINCLKKNQIENKGNKILDLKKNRIQKIALKLAQNHSQKNEITNLVQDLLRF